MRSPEKAHTVLKIVGLGPQKTEINFQRQAEQEQPSKERKEMIDPNKINNCFKNYNEIPLTPTTIATNRKPGNTKCWQEFDTTGTLVQFWWD